MHRYSLVIVVALLSACTTTRPQLRLRSMPDIAPPSLPRLDEKSLDITTVNAETLRALATQLDVLSEIRKVYANCITAADRLQDQANKAHDRQVKVKTVVGVINGGIATIGGLVAGIADAADDNVMDPSNLPTGAGIATAVVGAVGLGSVAIWTPGENELSSIKKRMDRINSYLDDIKEWLNNNGDYTKWTEAEKTEWYRLLGLADGYCLNPK